MYSLKLTVPLLILLAALSVIGTIIPQNASEHQYLRLYSKETYYVLKGLGLLDMYHSWWFIGALVLLVINLTGCSLKRLPALWQQVRETKKGYARLGTYLTHLSVLLILLGGLIGAVWGFRGYVEIAEGETVKGIFLNSPQRVKRPLGFKVRCDAFHVDFYPDGSPKEYVSTLTFMEGEKVALDHVPLRVNHPITYRGLTFYQASYGISDRSSKAILEVRKRGGREDSITMKLGQGQIRPIPGTQSQIGFMKYRAKVHDLGEAILLVLFSLHSPPESFWLFKRFSGIEGWQVGNFVFVFKDLEKRYYTGIQVTRDPGVPIVWVGFTLLMIGMVVTFTLRRPQKRQPSQED
ncbi:MAG: cytochrome c biogenesis protein ResB [Deltaproteobacteria bacterium]|nr:cytochrome c biogenesis protein ResB [Deltaproteobacteria bacterium]